TPIRRVKGTGRTTDILPGWNCRMAGFTSWIIPTAATRRPAPTCTGPTCHPPISPGRGCMTMRLYLPGTLLLLLLHAAAPRHPDPPPPEVTVIRAGENGYNTLRIPALMATEKGTLLAFAEGRRNSRSDTGDIDRVLKRSFDDGKTWTKLMVIA